MSHWHDFFVTESVEEVVEIFRRHRLRVDYNEGISPRGHARGFVENGLGGMIMSSKVWRAGVNKKSQSCIEISEGFKGFKKIRRVIARRLSVVL